MEVSVTKPNPPYDDVAPDASSMIESMRAHGYTLPTAVADFIDNSIAAGCRSVWLRFEWAGSDSWISITDDGSGMSEEALVGAMRLGSQNPLEARDPTDLGRFGLGLKTASFSQARRLTVRSVTEAGEDSLRRWDLDHLAKPDVQGWQLLRTAHPDTGNRIEEFERNALVKGTVVLLEVLDRVTGAGDGLAATEATEDHFVSEIARVREHLEMVFHQFISDPPNKKITIYINGIPVEPWDPFVTDHPATESFPPDRFPADPATERFRSVKVMGYVLPHRDRFDESDPVNSKSLHKKAGGPAGWNAQQGFYLYRSRRLIIPGAWLGLGPGNNGWKKEEHFKLARLRLDIPNSMDQEWQIDVKKSTALAPPALRGWLTGLAKTVRERAKQVYAHRGKYGPRDPRKDEHAYPWVTNKRAGGVFSYRIDRGNSILEALIDSLSPDGKKRLETLLRLIEETVPVQRIWIDAAENQDAVARPFEAEAVAKLRGHIRTCHEVLCANGSAPLTAWEQISDFAAFQGTSAQAIIASLREETGLL